MLRRGPNKLASTTLSILFILIVLAGALVYRGQSYSTLNPGFEGAKCYFYGADFRFPDEKWQGNYVVHKYQDAGTELCYWSSSSWGGLSEKEYTYWANVGTPNDAGIGTRFEWANGPSWGATEHPQLKVHVESNIALDDINRQGATDPLGWNDSDLMSGRRIEYWSKHAVQVEQNAEKIAFHYTLTKESFLVVPAEFWVGFYLVPAQKDANTGSGWREGEWTNVACWFMLDWTSWDNAYQDPWLDDPQINVFDSLYNGSVLNKQKTPEYRGGFPIAAWIQGWQKADYSSDGPRTDSVWFDILHDDDKSKYTVEQLTQLKQALMAKCEFSPGLVGQFLSLYTEPDAQFSYETPLKKDSEFEDVSTYAKTPDSSMKQTMYFPINVQNFGTYAESRGFMQGWNVYYPSAYFRIRILYGVYGSFTYLWTEELKKDPVVNYPNETEHHGTTVITTQPSLLSMGLSGLASNPMFWLIVIALIIVGLIIIWIFFGLPIFVSLTSMRGIRCYRPQPGGDRSG